MLTLSPGCTCDVCAEEFGVHRLPHSIPCGHVLCASCCQNIVEKTSPRLAPVCPFCRESFAANDPRPIRMDFATSGWSTPHRVPDSYSQDTFSSDLIKRKTAQLLSHNPNASDVRKLEMKVAKAATNKCSVEEVFKLCAELERWISETEDHTVSLVLSAALLRAIIANHVSHSESSKAAKASDASLRHKIQALEAENARLDAENKRQRTQLQQKSQETNQLRLLHTTVADSQSAPTTPDRHRAISPTPAPSSAHHMRSQPTSPTPYSSGQGHYNPSSSASAAAAASMTSRFNTLHQRSASMSSRPVTPASMSFSHSQGPPPSASAAHSVRSQTPGISSSSAAAAAASARRSHTPGPGHSSASASAAAAAHAAQLSSRSHTPAPTPVRSQTPGAGRYSSSQVPPPVPPMPNGASIPRYSTPAPIPPPVSSSAQYTATYTHSHSSSLAAAGIHRGSTPGPIPPPKPRRMSVSVNDHSPPRVNRSTSDEKASHQRWIPTTVVDDSEYGTPPGPNYMHGAKLGHVRSVSRAGFAVR